MAGTQNKRTLTNPCSYKRRGLTAPGNSNGCQCQVSKGRYHAIAEDYEDQGLDLDLPSMMLQDERDVPLEANDRSRQLLAQDRPEAGL